MNIQAALPLTPAETALIEAYAARIADLPGDGAVMARRDAAIETLKSGLPTRRVEAWHYTDLRRLMALPPPFDPAARVEPLEPLLEGAVVFALLNGRSQPAKAIDGVSVSPLAEALEAGRLADRLQPAEWHDAVGAINAAFVSDGYSVEVAAGAEIERPIELQNVHGGGQAHVRFLADIGAGARATFIERQAGKGVALVSSISEIEIGDGAEVTWVVLQEQPSDVSGLARLKARIGRKARLRLVVLNAGGRLVRHEIEVAIVGERADFALRVVNLLAGNGHTDVTMTVDHRGEGATSREIARNVVMERAQGVFQGQIRVARKAQKTDAKMSCNTLLLSDEAEFASKPELEIFADDVACGHGATVAQIDRDHLFYLMARGIPEKEARGLLIKAFLLEIVEELEEEKLVEALEERIENWFATHG
jgi:Fe-S cluster assembly protein SufD